MNPLVDDIFDIFPVWPYLSPSSLEYCDSFESMDLFQIDNNGHTQEGCHLLPESMPEEYVPNPDFPAIVDFAGPALSSPFIPPMPEAPFNDLMNYNQEQEILISPPFSLCSSSSCASSQKSPPAKRNTRIGFCEHPKHVLYRQSHSVITADSKSTQNPFHPQHYHHYHRHHSENHCQKHICKKLCRHHHYLHHLKQQQQQEGDILRPTDTAFIATTPRRGRPPKGAKSSETTMPPPPLPVNDAATTDLTLSTDRLINTTTSSDPCSLPVENDDSHYTAKINYHIPMTTRPLPKRLEPVVGKSNIHVCLTCLKRSDMDVDYLLHPTYIAPQSSKKKKRVLSSPNLA